MSADNWGSSHTVHMPFPVMGQRSNDPPPRLPPKRKTKEQRKAAKKEQKKTKREMTDATIGADVKDSSQVSQENIDLLNAAAARLLSKIAREGEIHRETHPEVFSFIDKHSLSEDRIRSLAFGGRYGDF